MNIYKTIDLCAGIGGIRKGFELTGRTVNVLSAENDKFACMTYEHLYGENPMNDITSDEFKKLMTKTEYDILLAGFPCQAFSAVGKQEGFKDTTRGTIFFHIAEMIENNRPKCFLLENVEGLITHKKGETFRIILDTLINKLEYHIIGVEVDKTGENFIFNKNEIVLNAKNFGLPQNRPRVYIVGFDKRKYGEKLNNIEFKMLPQKRKQGCIYNDLNEVLEMNADPSFYLSQGYVDTLKSHKEAQGAKGNGFGYMIVNDPNIKKPISNALLATGGSGKERNLVYDPQEGISGIKVKGKQTPLNNEYIRIMKPEEWGKLQGFIGYAFMNNGKDLFSFPTSISKTQQYKQFGNSVAVPVIEEIAKEIINTLDSLNKKNIKGREIIMDYNKGEWSEAYAFVKLLGEGQVYAADKNNQRNEDEVYPVLKMIRDEIQKQYLRNHENDSVQISDLSGNVIKEMSPQEFIEIADRSLPLIRNGKGRSFKVPILENFLRGLEIISFKSSSKEKSDLKMEIYDFNIEQARTHTFSVKSELGNNATLLNASQATNFTCIVNGMSKEDFEALNNISGKSILKDRFSIIQSKMKEGTYNVFFEGVSNKIFEANLRLIDTRLDYIISCLLMSFYSKSASSSSIKDLTECVIENNPLKVSEEEKELFYKTKIIELIKAATFGMMPTEKWDKTYNVTGGILNVKYTGEILCYHLFYGKDSLDEYLYNNTKLETASTGKHKFGNLYESDGNYKFDLNLQIRMK